MNALTDNLRALPGASAPAPQGTGRVSTFAWFYLPARLAGRPSHDHNRLIASVGINADMRREFARELASRLRQAKGPVHLVLPLQGIQEWDRAGAPLHDPEGLAAMMDEMAQCDWGAAEVSRIDAHINDAAFVPQVPVVFDDWLARWRLLPSQAKKAAHV